MYLTLFFRSKKRLLLNLFLLLAVTAFFCMSVNLYKNSVDNLQKADETYSTIAIMELHGSVNSSGELLEEPNGRMRQVAVTGYDYSPILEASGVIKHDLRSKYGIVIDGTIAMGSDGTNPLTEYDIIRFRLAQDEPVTVPVIWDYADYSRGNQQEVFLEVLDSAAGCFDYNNGKPFRVRDILMDGQLESYGEDIAQLNRSEEYGSITLYPGVEYVAINQLSSGWEKDRPLDKIYHNAYQIDLTLANRLDYFADGFSVHYSEDGTETISTLWLGGWKARGGMPCPIMRWEDVLVSPEIKAAYTGLWDAAKYNVSTFFATLTEDITGVPLYHLGGAYLRSGRMITEEEYQTGEKVCMVSGKLANMQGWRVGDRLDLRFFRFDAFPNMSSDVINQQPIYHKNTEGFFDEGQYEIVGIFDTRDQGANSGISESTVKQPWNTVYLPTNSVRNTLPTEALPVHGALLTFWLENGSIPEFLSDVEAMGLLEEDLTRYNPKFIFYDQGYSTIQPSLQSLHGAARLLLGLSSLLLMITSALLAWFFAQNHRHNVGILRMLGGTRCRALVSLVLCTLLIALPGGAAGAVIGHTLAQRTGQLILEDSLAESEQTAGFRSYVMATEDGETQPLSVTANQQVSALAACAALLFPLLTMLFTLTYINREPRALLPGAKP